MNDRLQQLRAELEKGRQRMQALDRERDNVRETMLRISGAIQVLEELMEQENHLRAETQLATVA
jgi:prefoldin subunit 5